MSIFIVAVFIIGYVGIAFENGLKINKAAIALLMCVICWVLYMFGSADYVELYHNEAFHNFLSEFHSEDMTAAVRQFVGENILLAHLGDTCEILFFLMGAMAIVEVVDANGGFNFVRDRLATTQKRKLLWRIVIMTFLLSSVLDNLTTSIVMIMVLRKLVAVREDRLIYSAMVILAANAGGAFSPIGDVTTIMLWIKGNITSVGVIKEVFLPSVISVVVPALLLQGKLKGELETVKNEETSSEVSFSRLERNIVFWVGVGGLIFVPIFRTVTGLPPFMGILLILGILWAVTEIFLSNNRNAKELKKQRVSKLLSRIDLSTILFFLGILMAVSALQEIGVLSAFGTWLEEVSNGDAYLVTGVVGIVSSIVDNVPLVECKRIEKAACVEIAFTH